MKIVTSELSKEIISLFIPKPVLDMNPVVAGGFALSLYMTTLAAQDPTVGSFILAELNNKKKKAELILKFSDIDLWFLRENSLVETDTFKEVFFGQVGKEELPQRILHTSSTNSFHKATTSSNHSVVMSLEKSSLWANTFMFKGAWAPTHSYPIQFVKKQQKDVESLLKSFDFKVSSVAWMDGSFYILDGFEESVAKKTLELNEGEAKRLKKQKFGTKIFQSIRTFKYFNRFNFEFSKELFDHIVENMMLASDYLLKVEEARKQEAAGAQGRVKFSSTYTGKISVSSSNPNYLEEVTNTETMQGMCVSLCQNFDMLTKMSHWDDSIALFFANSKVINIRHILDAKINAQSKTDSSPYPPFVIPF